MTTSSPAGPQTLRISSGNVRVLVEALDIEEIDVTGHSAIEIPDGIEIRPTGPCEVRVPIGTNVIVGSANGDIETRGQLGRVAVSSDNGHITIECADEIDIRNANGEIKIGDCRGECRVHTTNAKVSLELAGSADLTTKNGHIDCQCVTGDATIRSVNGHVSLGVEGGGDVDVEVINAQVDVEIPSHCCPHVTTESCCDHVDAPVTAGTDFEIAVKSANGQVSVNYR
ncbi:MAG: hypothetical protein ACC652_05295 [Acidimicrobiales bacterium]